MRCKRIITRMVTLATAVTIAAYTTCVTALAAPAISLELGTSGDSTDSLQVMLSSEQRKQLIGAAGDKLAAGDGMVNLTLEARRLDSEDATMPQEIVAAEPVLVGKLTMTWRVGSDEATAMPRIDTPIQLTIVLPAELHGGSYSVSCFDGSSYTSAADLDTVPNTITLATMAMDRFVVTRSAVEVPKPVAVAPVAPALPKPTTVVNPTAGGVVDGLAPRTVLAQAVPSSMPIVPVAPAQSGVSSSMAATSMMMTAAFVSGTIDYENSQQQGSDDEQDEGDDADAEESSDVGYFDEDAEDGIEEELEGFRELRYR